LPAEADASMNLATQITHGARKRVIREEEYRKTQNTGYSFRPAINEKSANINRGLDEMLQDG